MSNFGGDQAVSASHPFVFEVDAGGSCHRLNTSFLHYYYYFSGGKKKEGVGEGGGAGLLTRESVATFTFSLIICIKTGKCFYRLSQWCYGN